MFQFQSKMFFIRWKLFMFMFLSVLSVSTEQSAPSWPTMEWCWLQTGWQGPQGGKGGATCKPAAPTDSDSSFCTSSSSLLYLQTVSPPPLLLPCSPSSPPLLLIFSFLPPWFFYIVRLLVQTLSLTWCLSWWNLPPATRCAGVSMSWLSRLNPRGPGSRSGRTAAPLSPCTADPETCLMVFKNHWRQVSAYLNS